MSDAPTVLPAPKLLDLIGVRATENAITLAARTSSRVARCPVCGARSARVHSHYTRMLADLPWGGRSVRLSLLVRRFRCSAPACPRPIFAERLASVAEPYARKTTRLHELLRLVGFVLGGEGGARPLCHLGMSASSSTLLRYVRDSPSVRTSTTPCPRDRRLGFPTRPPLRHHSRRSGETRGDRPT
jgi:zinc-finger of transposase IS204/IS1001/IS1096/IS1165